MIAAKTPLTEIGMEDLKRALGRIRETVPVGFEHHKEEQDRDLMPEKETDYIVQLMRVVSGQWKSALHQIGTLGGGNHFIEIQRGSDGHIWAMIHSGSRNLGKQVADHYNKLAVALNEKWHTEVPKEWQLAFLPLDSGEGKAYMLEMQYCVDFALANRKLMMRRVLEALGVGAIEEVNIAHNYASMEHHFGKNVLVHRKGATLAREGTIGIIPGSQGTKSYIVRGKGNPESFESCSHGAGRKMSRTEAQKTLDLDAEKKRLDDQGILHAIRGKNDLDEASGAYKDIDVVMRNQSDLVDITVELTPLAVVKG